jgi:hypothetical protein
MAIEMPLRRASAAALILSALLSARPAAACSCVTTSEPRDPDVLLLGGQQPLPTNARIRLLYEGGAVRSDDGKTLLPAAAITHVVRTAAGAAVAVEPHVIKTSVETYVELLPHKPLLPRTRYEVVLTHAGEKDYLVGRFLTADAPDRTAPVFAGVRRCAAGGPAPGRRRRVHHRPALEYLLDPGHGQRQGATVLCRMDGAIRRRD